MRCEACGHENRVGAKFCEECATPLGATEPSTEVRKTVTVMFCDVAGSTALAEALDPESVRHVMERYFDAMQATIHHHGGTVEKFIGDAVMAVFGVPRVHEDDALRAVRAAADMDTALARLNEDLDRDYGITLSARIGVNTGEVVAGVSDQKIVTGDAVNIAARLEQVAAPGEILLGAGTLALVRDAVIAEPIDLLHLKGKRDPVPAFRLREVTRGAAGFARHLDAPIVGRADELSIMVDAFDRMVADQACRILTILGAAGVGKSRLIAAFVEQLGDRATVLRGRCLPYGEGITFHPLTEALIEAADLDEADAPQAARAKLAALVRPSEEADRVAERVGHAIGIPGSETAPEETLWAIRMLLQGLAAERPTIFVVDDLQWAEPKFLELLEHVAELARLAPILLACMTRPEFSDDHPRWTDRPEATTIVLEPLDPQDCSTLVANLLADDTIDAGVRMRIAEAAEGNPLYAEEITGFLVDGGSLALKEGRWEAVGDLGDVPVPPTISALLAARLEQLAPEERRLIEIGSVMGQVFYPSAVQELTDMRPRAVEVGLRSLVGKRFVFPERSDMPGIDALGFRHLLIRDEAYRSIPKTTRAKLHERFADWYADSGGAVGEQDEILGYHLQQAYRSLTELGKVDDRAKALGRRAGEHLAGAGFRAFARGDYLATVGLLDRAVAVLPSDHPRLPNIQGRLFNSFLETGEHARAAEANARHRQSAISMRDRVEEQRAELGAVELFLYEAPRDLTTREIDETAHRAMEVFERSGDDEGLLMAHIFLSEAALRDGKVMDSNSEAETALIHGLRSGASVLLTYAVNKITWTLFLGPNSASAGSDRLERLADQLIDHQVARIDAQVSQAWFLAYLGRFDDAGELTRSCLKVYEDLGQSSNVAWTTSVLGWIDWLRGEPSATESVFRDYCGVLRDFGDDFNLAEAMTDLSELLIDLRREQEALDILEEVPAMLSRDQLREQIRWRALRSVALARLGRIAEAVPLISEAERRVRQTDLVVTLADTVLAKAEVLKLAERGTEATSAAREALGLFEAKGFVPHIGEARAMVASLKS